MCVCICVCAYVCVSACARLCVCVCVCVCVRACVCKDVICQPQTAHVFKIPSSQPSQSQYLLLVKGVLNHRGSAKEWCREQSDWKFNTSVLTTLSATLK